MATTDYNLLIESVRGELKRDANHDGIDIHRFEFGAELAR